MVEVLARVLKAQAANPIPMATFLMDIVKCLNVWSVVNPNSQFLSDP